MAINWTKVDQQIELENQQAKKKREEQARFENELLRKAAQETVKQEKPQTGTVSTPYYFARGNARTAARVAGMQQKSEQNKSWLEQARQTAAQLKGYDEPRVGRLGYAAESIGRRMVGTIPAIAETASQYKENYRRDNDNQAMQQARKRESELLNSITYMQKNGIGTYQGKTLDEMRAELEQVQRTMVSERDRTAVDMDGFGQQMMLRSAQAAEKTTEGMSSAGKFVADAALSVASNAAMMPLDLIAPGLSLAAMGMTAGADRMVELNQRGIDPTESFTRGVASGAIETITEKLPLDMVYDVFKTGGIGAMRSLIRQAGVEGAEEGISYLANYFADKLAGDPEAQFSLEELAASIGGGALAGGMMGGIALGGNRLFYGTNAQEPLALPQGRTFAEMDTHNVQSPAAAPSAAADMTEQYQSQAEELAAQLGENGGKAFLHAWGGNGSPVDIFRDFARVYNAAKNGQQADTGSLTEAQVLAATDSGRLDGEVSKTEQAQGAAEQNISEQRVSEGATEAETEMPAPIVESVLNGEEITGEDAEKIAEDDAAVSENETGEQNAPAEEVLDSVLEIANRNADTESTQAKNTEAEQTGNVLAEEGEKGYTQGNPDGQTKHHSLSGGNRTKYSADRKSGGFLVSIGRGDTKTVESKDTPSSKGLFDLNGQLAKRDAVTVNGIKYTIDRNDDGYFVSIDRDDAQIDGYVTNARSHLYGAGPFSTREEAMQEALDVARANKLTEQEDTGNGERAPSEIPDRERASEPARSGENAAEQTSGNEAEGNAVSPQQQIADAVKKYLSEGKDFTAARLFEISDKAYGGTMASGSYTVKDAYDGMELAVNQYLMHLDAVKNGNGDAAQAVKTLNKLIDLLSHIPTQTKRSAETESHQQFSTPPNIAYLAAWCANVNEQDIALEPSAGIGGLALWPKAWGATVYANELSERRLAFLNQLGLDRTFNLNAEQIDNLLPDSIKPSVVLMNPPFSSAVGRTTKKSTANAKRHIEQALDRLSEGGRLVAILGNGMADDAPAFRSWWNDLRKEYSVRANIRIDGQNYRKYGTTFDVQLVVIDKTGPNTEQTLTGTFKDLSEIPAFMEEIRNDRTRARSQDSPVSEPVSNGDMGRKPDSGVRTVRAEGSERGVRGNGIHDGQGNYERTVQQYGDRGTGGGLQQQNGVGEIAEAETGRGGDGGRVSGNDSVKLQLDRSDLVNKQAQKTASKEIAENPDSVYAAYTPKKVHIKGAQKHPAKLVESAAMAAVEPPDVTYTPSLPENLVTGGKLSDAQLENIVYAGQAHSQMLQNKSRKGYFIGDGTGVGKGRQLSGIIMDNFLQGRDRAIWVSDKPQLINDAIRDWKDLGGNQEDVLDFSKYKLGQDISAKRGIMFMSYDTLKYGKNDKTRLGDLERWLGKDFDGVICFDEAHNMANSAGKQGKRGKTKPSQKALAGIKLQQMFPNARIVYASATGATDIGDYAYLERLGLWGPGTAFNDSLDFTSKISAGGLAAMELVARDMKSMGVYMARSISYDDVTYDTLQHDLTPMQTEIYDTMSRAWQSIFQNIEKALGDTGASLNGAAKSAAWSAFYSTQQRFYNQIITSMSMPSVVEDMRRELENGRSCVLQIVNTNEAAADRAIAQVEDKGLSLDDMDLTPTESLVQYLTNSFPIQEYEEYTDEKGNKLSRPVVDKDGNPVLSKKAIRQRDELIEQIKQMRVPDGPLEILFDAFGVDQVAEVTGRTRRVVEKADENGQMHRVVENRSGKAGIADAQMFQDGKKRILVFSDAGGTGRSYHADLRAKNQQQRVHYLLQPGWNASKATQGFGRTHRSNEASAPVFRLVTTNVMGQKRFTSTIARRLDQLGALTKGQRQAGSGIFGEKDNLEGPVAQDALQQYYKQLPVDIVKKLGLYQKLYDTRTGAFKTEDNAASRDIGMFLNRILSLEVEEQNRVFQGFYDTFERMMDAAIANGTVDMGLENYRADKIEVKDEKVIRKDPSGADTKYVQMTAYNKPELIPLSAAKKMHDRFQGLVRLEDGGVRAVYEISSKTNPKTGEVQRRFKLESPVRGKSSVYVEETLKSKTKPIEKSGWAAAWKEETAKAPKYTESTLHLLTGTLLPIWDRLPENNTRVMRVVSSDGKQYLGRVIRADQIDGVLKVLGSSRTMQTYTPQQINDAVLTQGKEVVLRDNKWKISRRRVSGEWRMEITGQNTWYLQRQYPDIITERINFEYRYFIPTGKNGEKVLSDLMKNNPVVDVREQAQTDDVDQMRGGRNPDHRDEWTANRVGDRTKKPKSLSEIVEQIRHDYGLNITAGRIRGSDIRGQYDRRSHGIRSRIANDLPVIAHELGHHFDSTYGLRDGMTSSMKQELLDGLDPTLSDRYSKNRLLGEGIAEYVRKFLQNREVAAIDCPEFHKYFMQQFDGKDLATLEQLADEVNAYYSMDADTATSSIRLREEGTPDARTIGEKIKAKASVLYQAWTDSNHGIKRFDDATGGNTYKLASNAAYSDAIAGQIVVGDLTDANGKYVAPGLKAALHGLNLKNKQEYRLFGEYLLVKHGPERLAEGMRIFADDRKNSTAFMQRRQAELERQYPHFKKVSENLYDFQRKFLQTWGVDTGLVSQQSADEWGERWEFYVPLNRAVSTEKRGIGAKRGFANQNSTIKRARGSGLDVVHPVDNIVNNIVKMVNAGVRNNVMRAITDTAEAMGADAAFLEKVPTPMVRRGFDMTGVKAQLTDWFGESDMQVSDKLKAAGIVSNLDDVLYQYGRGKAHGDVITVLKNGNQEFWKINDPLLLTSLTNLAPAKMHSVMEAYGTVTRFMTSVITGSDVVWSIFSNMPRDLQTVFAYSDKKNPAKLASAIGSAYLNKAKGQKADPLYKEYLALGGGNTSAYTADRNLAKKARQSLSRRRFSLNPIEWIGFVGDTIESGPRFATYKLLREAGMSEQEAFYEAMDITVNFRRGGQVSRGINKFVPFFNAAVQGADKFRRYYSGADYAGKPGRAKVVRGRVLWLITANAILAAAMTALNMGDDDDKEAYAQLSNYTKNNFFLFPIKDEDGNATGKYFAMPKGRDVAYLSSLFSTCIEYFAAGNKHAFDEFYSYTVDTFAPNGISDALQGDIEGAVGSLGIVGVISDLKANRDFIGRPIVSSGLQYLETKDQFNEKTSQLAYWIGQAFDVPPMKVDYFAKQVFGMFGKYNQALFPVGGADARDLTLGVANRYLKDNQYSTDLVNWLYSQAEASQKAKNSDSGNMEKAITFKMDNNMTTFYSRYYSLAKSAANTETNRGVRQTVLDMISEYREAYDAGTVTSQQSAVYSVCEKAGSTEYLPSVMQDYVKDGNEESHALSAAEYVDYQTDYLRLYWSYVEENLDTRDSTEKQAEILKAAKTAAKEQASNTVLRRIGAPTTKYAEKYNGLDDSDVIEYKARIASETDGTPKQEEAIKILKDMIASGSTTKQEAYLLFQSSWSKSDKNNPWRSYKPKYR